MLVPRAGKECLINRNEYIQKLQTDLDHWNSQIAAWEETVRESQGELHSRLEEHLASWRDQRDLAAERLREVERAGASTKRKLSHA
jgi:flagellar biosynthesis chaperone FliJ